MNIQDIKSAYSIEDVIGRYVSLKPQGPERVGNCPFHNDEHASMKVNPKKQKYKCFACGAGGDMFDFIINQGFAANHAEAKKIITNGQDLTPAPYIPPAPTEPEWIDCVPPQDQLPNPLEIYFKPHESRPNRFWTYHNADGLVISYVCRFDLPEGKKDVIPYTYKTNGTKSEWKWKGLDTPRPLYNLHEINRRPNDPIILTEGEKAADAAAMLFPDFIASTWIGGKDNVKHADLSPLAGRNVYLWADNDQAGVLAMYGGWDNRDGLSAYTRFLGVTDRVSANFTAIRNQPDFPKKWDIADATWSPAEANEYLRANTTTPPSVSDYPPGETPAPAPPLPPVNLTPAPAPPTKKPENSMDNQYFRQLGFEKNNDQTIYVFFVLRSSIIIKLSPGGINTSNLLQLAPLDFWERMYPKITRSSGGVKHDITRIVDVIISQGVEIGMFNPSRLRGRGAWIDNGVPVIHCGDKLIVDGLETPLSKIKSKFLYEAGQELGFSLKTPATKQEANELIAILKRLNWVRDINALLLAGWIVVAPVCGALNWRPHIWITGAAGTGKSWVMNNLIKKMLGEMLISVQGATSEAGIRQFLKSDALPVKFDEAESENKKSEEKMQQVLEIMRSSSTSDGGKILKGSASGDSVGYDIKSCFAFASIGNSITQRSDATRVTVLELLMDETPGKAQKWNDTQEMYFRIVTSEFVDRFQSRTVWLLPTILKNAQVFSNAAAIVLGSQRAGDQIGILLAGAYSLTSDNVISFEDAKKWIAERDWSEERLLDETKDEIKLIGQIMEADIIVETGLGKYTRTVGDLVLAARGTDVRSPLETGLITLEAARETLKRNGIIIQGTDVVFSDASKFITRSLSGRSPYAKNYHTILMRVPGAEKLTGVAFGSHIKGRATKISSFEIFGETKSDPIRVMPPKVEEFQGNLNF